MCLAQSRLQFWTKYGYYRDAKKNEKGKDSGSQLVTNYLCPTCPISVIKRLCYRKCYYRKSPLIRTHNHLLSKCTLTDEAITPFIGTSILTQLILKKNLVLVSISNLPPFSDDLWKLILGLITWFMALVLLPKFCTSRSPV